MNSPNATFSSGVVRISVTCGVVHVELPVARTAAGTVSTRAEVDHVERRRPSRRTGTPVRAIAPRRSGPAGKTPPTTRSATSVVVMSSTAGDQAGVDELLHRLPAGAGGVEDERVVAVARAPRRAGDERRGDAEHRQPDARAGLRRWPAPGGPTMPGEGVGGVAEHLSRDAVEPGDVGDRVHHRDVGGADVRRDVARRDRRHHHLRHADGQGPHRRGDQRGAAGSADADDAGDRRHASATNALERHRHRGDGRAAVAAEHGAGAVGVVRGDLVGRDVGRPSTVSRVVPTSTTTVLDPAARRTTSRDVASSRPSCRGCRRRTATVTAVSSGTPGGRRPAPGSPEQASTSCCSACTSPPPPRRCAG